MSTKTNEKNLVGNGSTATVKKFDVKQLTGLGILTAIVVVLQCIAIAIRPFGFNFALVLVPIVIGAALYGVKAGAWLGFVFGVVVTITDSAAFMVVNPPATIAVCVLKGLLAGLAAGAVYKLLENKNRTVAVFASAVTCPIVNTGVFLIGCVLFFMDTITEWAVGLGFESAGAYMIFGLVGVNFLVEAAINIVLSSVIVRILQIVKK